MAEETATIHRYQGHDQWRCGIPNGTFVACIPADYDDEKMIICFTLPDLHDPECSAYLSGLGPELASIQVIDRGEDPWGMIPANDAEVQQAVERAEVQEKTGVPLCENDWVSLMVVRDPGKGVDGYVYSHETRCRGRIVAVLPWRSVDSDGSREYLLKSEITPCWSMDHQVLSSVTGGWEGGAIEEDAVREMLEETGYAVTAGELQPLGTCYASKSADTIYSLFAVDVTGKAQGEAPGDGSRIEAESGTVWLTFAGLRDIQDPLVSVMALRLVLGWTPGVN